MIDFAADQNFDMTIVRGVWRVNPTIDVVHESEEIDPKSKDDVVLEWAARRGLVLLTHDTRTMPTFAYDRVERGLSMPGVIVVRKKLPIGSVIEDILLMAEYSTPGEYDGHVKYLPL